MLIVDIMLKMDKILEDKIELKQKLNIVMFNMNQLELFIQFHHLIFHFGYVLNQLFL